MIIKFSTKKGQLILNKEKSNFQHSEEMHKLHKPKIRMKQDTYEDFQHLNEIHGDLKEFKLKHPDLQHFPMKSIYNERTKANRLLNDIEYIVNELNELEDFRSAIIKTKDKVIVGCVVVNVHIIRSCFCDVLVIDDSVGINSLHYPVENVVCKDPNGCLQLVAFGLLSSKTEEGFEEFLNQFKIISELERTKANLEKDFLKIVVCDRLKAQRNAVLKVFNNCNIIYCREHIIRNIKNNNQTLNFLNACEDMLHNRTKESEDIFKKMLDSLPNSKFKLELINDFEHYAPSVVDKLYHRGILTSNAAETSFSTLKMDCKHMLQPLMTTLQMLISISRDWMTNSIEKIEVVIPEILQGKIPNNTGKWAVQYLLNEIKESIYISSKVKCNCKNRVYKLPCRHFFAHQRQYGMEIPHLNIEKEYLNLDKNILSLEIIEPVPCMIEEVNKEEEVDSLSLMKELYLLPNSLKFRNKIGRMIINYIETEKYKNKTTPSMCNPPAGHTKFSHNCNVSKRYKENKKKGKKKEKIEKKPKK